MNRIFYTKNVCNKGYCSIRLVCNAESKKEAFEKFKIYSKDKSFWINLSIKEVRELKKPVKEFSYIE